ncbi:MAG: trypsin-like peptidase domain-containing protein [Spirochaetales bacterium]|nr:trypsin-like peptidase domain-containing protein [Spirochaetales bacterium]
MRKRLFLCPILILLVTGAGFAQEEETRIFELYKDGIVYIDQALYFKSETVERKDLFRKLEEKYSTPLLDAHFPISCGSGFMITETGAIVTNYHVMDSEDIEKRREGTYWYLMEMFAKDLPEGFFSSNEFDILMKSFKRLFDTSEFSYRVRVANETYYKPEILAYDEKLDLALLKIEEKEKFTSLPIGDSDELKVGNRVIAIGYPFQITMDWFLKDFKSTLTTGTVSSLRKDLQGIQHTATVNPGNSGGPLITTSGRVVGVNVSILKDAQNICFAIPSKKLTQWLEKKGYKNLLAMNRKIDTTIFSSGFIDAGGVLEIGTSLFIKLEEKCNVYIDGESKGTTPLLLSDLKEGESYLEIESDTLYHGRRIGVNPARKDIVTYSPKMGKFVGNLYIESSPSGADIFIDGRARGTTPAALSDLTAEKHTVEIVKNGYAVYQKEIEVVRKKTIDIKTTLEPAYRVTFKNPLPKGTTMKVKGKNLDKTFSSNESIELPSGKWTIVISNDKFFPDNTMEFEIKNDSITLAFDPAYFRSSIVFANLLPGSAVFLNNTDISDRIENDSFETVVGEYTVTVMKKDYFDYREKVILEKVKNAVVTINYIKDPAIDSVRYAWIGYPTLGAGLLAVGLGFILNMDDIAIDITPGYDEYVFIKWTSFSFACAGVVAVIVGGAYVYLSIRNSDESARLRKSMALSVDVTETGPCVVVRYRLR